MVLSGGVNVLDVLQPEHALLRTLVDHLPSMLAYWDLSQRCRFANRAYERWLGVSPEGLLGAHMSELLGPSYALELPYVDAALRGQPQKFERELPDPRGSAPRHAVADYIPDVTDGHVRGFFALLTDITELKRAELELRDSEERYRLALDEAPTGMALVTPDGRIERCNRAFCEVLGYAQEEALHLSLQNVTHPEDLDADRALAVKLTRGEIQRYQLEKRYIRKDGAPVEVIIRVSLLRKRDGSPSHFIAQVEDITLPKRLERELRSAEAKASGILDISADAVVSVDENHCITLFNAGAERIFRYRRAEVIGAPLEVLIPDRFRAAHRRHVARFAAGPDLARRMGGRGTAIFGLRKGGEEFPADGTISRLEISGQPVLTVAVRDVTDQKRSQDDQRFLAEVGAALAGSLDFDETLARIAELPVRELTDVCILEIEASDGDLQRCRIACGAVAKRELGDLSARVQDAACTYLLRGVIEKRQPLIAQQAPAEMFEALAPDDPRRALERCQISSLLAVPLITPSGLAGAMAWVSLNSSREYGVADLALAEEFARRAASTLENARLYRAARRASRAREDVLGVVAHDLRNPLNNILMHARLLRGTEVEPERRAGMEHARAIERAAIHMDRLIQDLLEVTRIETGNLLVQQTQLCTQQTIMDCVEGQRPLATAAGLELSIELAGELPDVWADRDRVLQVFENLIGNALKFTRAGGLITIGAQAGKDEVLFWVRDTGEGIDREQLPHVFERFWQGQKTRRTGSGLGLSIVKGIVEAHGGRIWVDAAPGQGTTFFFTLPTCVVPTNERASRSPI